MVLCCYYVVVLVCIAIGVLDLGKFFFSFFSSFF